MGLHVFKHTLQFKHPGGTSRGILKTKDSWIISCTDGEQFGVGESSLIEGLSPEKTELMEIRIDHCLEQWPALRIESIPANCPSIKFGLETLQKSYQNQDPFILFPSNFANGNNGISINGLIWMGEKDFMFNQIRQKLNEGFRCIKLKIGGIGFDEEISLLKYIRSQFGPEDVELRVDANGAFEVNRALDKLKALSEFQIHSIEQPIMPGQIQDMAQLCNDSPIPIALDEELIGVNQRIEKEKLLQAIQPHYIILKPSLLGGLLASDEWIELAKKHNIGWWATSALESNIGLNAIAQWVATKEPDLPQGLGTGSLYSNNIASPLKVKDAMLWYDTGQLWDYSFFNTAH